jgi:putative membrane protein
MNIAEVVGTVAQMGPWDGNMMDGWGWMWLFAIFWMVLLIVLIGVVVWAATRHSGSRDRDTNPRAREILRERYARGEISTEEYRERLDGLG